ncbi:helix-turn-helix domain-containing protein [Limnovirga soli]|uniref:Chromosomal replication initiator DnaA C-terminal domain-containing protein n=1 Tax=Limnovirga soli TaxID=2656915 RepID=A0A8J8FDF0_9BACT|nr:helix-turn-helix domain-containing protein [Limnovirga soli]NNV54563.1 hypothetical protein [Limnovirga soli]
MSMLLMPDVQPQIDEIIATARYNLNKVIGYPVVVDFNYYLVPLQPEAILYLVSKEYGFTVAQMRGKWRKTELSEARHMYSYIIKQLFPNRVERLTGKELNCDRTTVRYGATQIANKLWAKDEITLAHFNSIKERLINEAETYI